MRVSDTAPHEQHDEDAARLAALGYTSEFKRDMSLWANFSLGFTYLSPSTPCSPSRSRPADRP
jgi:hypothetical protein